jgi:hypothetical protein
LFLRRASGTRRQLKCTCRSDPSKRPSARTLLHDPWLAGVGGAPPGDDAVSRASRSRAPSLFSENHRRKVSSDDGPGLGAAPPLPPPAPPRRSVLISVSEAVEHAADDALEEPSHLLSMPQQARPRGSVDVSSRLSVDFSSAVSRPAAGHSYSRAGRLPRLSEVDVCQHLWRRHSSVMQMARVAGMVSCWRGLTTGHVFVCAWLMVSADAAAEHCGQCGRERPVELKGTRWSCAEQQCG